MRARVGETVADGRLVAGRLGDDGRGVFEERRLLVATADAVSVLLEVCVPSSNALTAIQYLERSPSASRKAPRYCVKFLSSIRPP